MVLLIKSSANMSGYKVLKSILIIQALTSLAAASETQEQPQSSDVPLISGSGVEQNDKQVVRERPNESPQAMPNNMVIANQITNGLEARMSDKNFIADILDRLHSLDADIGKLLFNSSSMYAADDQSEAFRQNQPKGGERFTEVLSDLDSLQDEVGGLINNATRTRQYNILVRLRPINTILYRIRHNLHLMRNSLVTINAISSLEKVSNDVIDTTLQAFLQPDANVGSELADDGNYDIDLNKPQNGTVQEPGVRGTGSSPLMAVSATTTTTTTPTTTTTTTTTTTPPPITAASTTTTTTKLPSSSTTRRSTRGPNRRVNNRHNQRRNSTTTTQRPNNSVTRQ